MTKDGRASRFVTLRDVARVAKVDASTVSMALRGHPRIPVTTRDRIRKVADQLGYLPDPALGRLAARRWLGKRSSETATLAYLSQIHHFGIEEDPYLRGVKDQASFLGYQVDIFSPKDYLNDRHLSDVIYTRGIRGLIVGQRTAMDREHHLAWQRFCIVQAGLNHPTDVLTLVRCDLDAALRQAHARLCAAGYRRILIYLPIDIGAASDRIWLETLKHLPSSKSGCVWKALIDRWENLDEALVLVRAWRPDAVLTVKSGIIDHWRSKGLRVPEEFAIACLHVESERPGIAGMNLQMERIGALAVDLVDTKLRRFDYGVPPSRLTLMIEPVWIPGPLLPEPARKNGMKYQ